MDDAPKSLAYYGLDKPQILVSLSVSTGGDKKKTLAFGKRVEEGVYCKIYDKDKKSVYLVGEEILSFVPSSKDELI